MQQKFYYHHTDYLCAYNEHKSGFMACYGTVLVQIKKN